MEIKIPHIITIDSKIGTLGINSKNVYLSMMWAAG